MQTAALLFSRKADDKSWRTVYNSGAVRASPAAPGSGALRFQEGMVFMKYLKQFGIILSVSCSGEILRFLLPWPIPASIYGLVLLFLLLALGIVKLDQVKDAGEFLIKIMPPMFIPAAVGLIDSWPQLKRLLLPLCVIIPLTTILVMLVTGKVTDFFVGRKEKSHE